jgi:hypothetical protein
MIPGTQKNGDEYNGRDAEESPESCQWYANPFTDSINRGEIAVTADEEIIFAIFRDDGSFAATVDASNKDIITNTIYNFFIITFIFSIVRLSFCV